MSQPLSTLSWTLVHMVNVLDRRIFIVDALLMVAEMESKLASMKIDNELDACTLEQLEDIAESLSEQIS